MTKISKAQRAALQWLLKHSAHAVLDQWGRCIADNGDRAPYQAQTFLRLVISGHVCRHDLHQQGGLGVTEKGIREKSR